MKTGTTGGLRQVFAGYAIDDQAAIKVVDDTVEVISEGHSKLFAPSPEGS